MFNVIILGFTLASKIPGDSFDTGLQNEGFYQGDIYDKTREFPYDPFRAAIPNSNRLWLDNIVTYSLDHSVSHLKELITDSMSEIELKTCIRFQERSQNIQDYVTITRKDGCWASMGRQGGEQEVSLGQRCESKGIILHELLHTLGLGHEHTRSDRDDYIDVLRYNIQKGRERNFDKLLPWENNLLGEPFDFKSVMMYGSLAFSKDGDSVTLASKHNIAERLPDVGEKQELSNGDVRKLNKLYECFGETRPPHPKVPPFICTFENSDCGIFNQQETGLSLWTRQTGKIESLFGDHSTPTGTGYYMSLTSRAAGGLPARLITPHFHHFERDYGCLSFYLHFFRADSFNVYIQTESETSVLISVNRSKAKQWQLYEVEISVDEKFRFLFEGNSNYENEGIIAIDDISFAWKQCRD